VGYNQSDIGEWPMNDLMRLQSQQRSMQRLAQQCQDAIGL